MSAVLVVRPSSLGDLVYALAVVADLRAHRPDIAIDWVAEESFVPVVALCPSIRRIIPVALRRWRRDIASLSTWREFAAFRKSLRRDEYAAVIDLQEQWKGAMLAWLARGPRHGVDRANIREPSATLLHDHHHAIGRNQHFVDRARGLAAAAMGYEVDGPPRFDLVAPPPSQDDIAPDGRYAVLFHGTSRAEKLWPEAHWRTLAAALGASGLRVLLAWGSTAERERSERIAAGIDSVTVPPFQSLAAVASLVARADAVVGVDTGFVHLAAALGTPTVAIFVATDVALMGAAAAGPNARDLGTTGVVPDPEEVRVALAQQVARALAA